MTNRTYVGNARRISTKYGDMMKLSFREEDLKKLQEGLTDGWVNAILKERKEPSKSGMTHYLELDEYKKPEKEEVKEESEDLPF